MCLRRNVGKLPEGCSLARSHTLRSSSNISDVLADCRCIILYIAAGLANSVDFVLKGKPEGVKMDILTGQREA